MHHKLAGQFCVDELYLWRCTKDGGQEIRTFRGKDNKEHLVFEDEGEDGEYYHDQDASQQHPTQFFEMIPERKHVRTLSFPPQ